MVHALRALLAQRDYKLASLSIIIIIIIIIIITKTAIYSKGYIFLSTSQLKRIADNTRRTGESHGMKERLQETPIQYTQR